MEVNHGVIAVRQVLPAFWRHPRNMDAEFRVQYHYVANAAGNPRPENMSWATEGRKIWREGTWL